MNTVSVVGKKETPNEFVLLYQGYVRQEEPDNEVATQVPAQSDHQTRVSQLFLEIPELHREISAGLVLRGHLGPPDLNQVPEEPDLMQPALPTGPPATPRPARAAAFMAHEAVREAEMPISALPPP